MKTFRPLYLLLTISLFFITASAQQSACLPVGAATTATQNHIISNTIKKDSVYAEVQINALTNCQLNQSVQYFDGIGRPIQRIDVKASPLGKDIIVPSAYDTFGRELIKYEPYADSGTPNGSFRSSAITSQRNFYKEGLAPASIQWTNAPFSVSVVESSPSGRVLQQGFPGLDWQPSSSRTDLTGRTVVSEYLVNDTLDVPYIRLTATGAIATDFYPGGKLFKTITKNENWTSGKINTTEEYKDFEGRIILKKVWQTNTVSLSTFYVYDDFGNLRCVVPPFPGAPSVVTLNENDDLVKKYCYVYHYDKRQRLIEKRLPGKEWEYIIYNNLDQVVLTQDGRQRPQRHWSFTKYDPFGRVAATGIYRHDIIASRESLQATVNNQIGVLWETWAGSGYTLNTFPKTPYFFHQIFKYDDYDMPLPPAYVLPVNREPKGLLTATLTFVDGTAQYLGSINYYDDYGRLIKNFKQHYASSTIDAGNYDETTNTYKFAGELETSTRVHRKTSASNLTIATAYDYDAWSRQIRTRKKINAEAEVVLAENLYNEVGSGAKEKQLYNGLQKTTYIHGQRGWLREMRSKEFTEMLMYGDSAGGNRNFNGNISYQKWGYSNTITPNIYTYTYDGLDRLTKGSSNPGSTNISETVTYDSMGNIVTMNRNGTTGTYNYSGNQLTRITGFETRPYQYYYDANGNMTKNGRNLDSLTYNALNLPKSVTRTGTTVNYLYAMDGTKLKKTSIIGGATVTTHYVDGIHYNGNNIEFIQTEEGIARRNTSSYSYEFNLKDHLGNVRVSFFKNPVTNALEVIQKDEYFAFGKRVVVTPGPNKYLYNGKELQVESETYDYGARFYDPVIARWTSVDPLGEKVMWESPYVYAANNPVNNIDPNGMETYYGDEARAMFAQMQSKESSNPPDEFNVDANGNKTKISNKGGIWYDYFNFAAGTTNPLSGKTLAIAAISGKVLGIANKPSDINFYVPVGSALLDNGRADNSYFFDGLMISGVIGKPLAEGLGTLGRFLGLTAKEASAGIEMTTVGRWMSTAEYNTMSKTGQMIEGAGGQTFVSTGGSNAFQAATKGSVYAEFQVPTNSLLQGGQSNWFKVLGPGANKSMQKALQKQGGQQLPNINNLSKILKIK